MKYLVIILFSFNFWSCKEDSAKTVKINSKELQSKSKTTNPNVSSKTKVLSDTIKLNEEVINKWYFNGEIISLVSSQKSDEYYNYGYLKLGNTESGEFIKIPKADSPYTGFEKIEIKFPYFTVEQSYREGDFTNYEYITFKKEGNIIFLDKYAVGYTNTHNIEQDIKGLRLYQKDIGKIQIKNVTSELLDTLRSNYFNRK